MTWGPGLFSVCKREQMNLCSVFYFLKMLNSAKTCLFHNKIIRAPKIMKNFM
jgi:hypothetical protein